MKNVSNTGTYNFYDFVFSKALRSLSHVVGLRKITQPFWSRWLASGVRSEVIFRFLDRLGSIDGWATAAREATEEEIARYHKELPKLDTKQKVTLLRELSYICNLAQWGCLPISQTRKDLYLMCRDYYIEAESIAFPDTYTRLDIAFEDLVLHGNLHKPAGNPAPLIVIVHGVDGCKEEHLATELHYLQEGFAVLGFDGPGQAEALVIDDILWRSSYPSAISAAIDAVEQLGDVGTQSTGVLGISIGSTWALQASASDRRIKAVYDLGGLLHTRSFSKYPFLIKTRICQLSGAQDKESVAKALRTNTIEDEAFLGTIRANIRILHGGSDRIVKLEDKVWLRDKLRDLAPDIDVSMRVIEGGDHCCTGHADEVRKDSAAFFAKML